MRLRCMVLALCVAGLMVLPGCGGGPSLRSIEIIPNNLTFGGAGLSAQLQAIAHYSKKNGTSSTQDVTSQVTWKSASSDVAMVDGGGKVTSKGPGTIQITATLDSGQGPIVGIANVTVTGTGTASGIRDLQSITVIPSSQTLSAPNQTAKFTAVGTYSAPPVVAVIENAAWDSSVKQVATIDQTGLATATGPGSTTITATGTTNSGAKILGTATLTESGVAVTTRDLLSISVIPVTQALSNIGDTAQYVAVGTYNTPPVTALIPSGVTWASSSQQIATLDSTKGLATATGFGNATVTATAASNSGAVLVGTANISVVPGPTQLPALTLVKLGPGAASAVVTSSPSSINCGTTCSASFPLGTIVTLTANPAPANWSSNCAVGAGGASCTVPVSTSTVVAAVFNP